MANKASPNNVFGVKIGPFLATIVLLLAGIRWYITGVEPAGKDSTPIRVVIPTGSGVRQIGAILKRKGLIKNDTLFSLLSVWGGRDKELKAGEYLLSTDMGLYRILDVLHSGRTELIQITIPEGLTFWQIGALLEKEGLADAKRFDTLCRDKNWFKDTGIQADTLEGYLFPETYRFEKNTTEEKIIKTMVNQFHQRFNSQRRQRAREMGMTPHQIITLASLIEKETAVDSERTLISAVFHNRLKKGIRLECDPTVIYALENFDGNIKKKDLFVDSPYNTYRYRGLPPGPIANPGENSLVAALFPTNSQAYYFVSKNNGTHHFSTTLSEHNRAVNRFQKRKKLNR
jgi:UPF0755 protein